MSIRIRSLVKRQILSEPVEGGKEVTNLYVEKIDGNPKLKVVYEDG